MTSLHVNEKFSSNILETCAQDFGKKEGQIKIHLKYTYLISYSIQHDWTNRKDITKYSKYLYPVTILSYSTWKQGPV